MVDLGTQGSRESSGKVDQLFSANTPLPNLPAEWAGDVVRKGTPGLTGEMSHYHEWIQQQLVSRKAAGDWRFGQAVVQFPLVGIDSADTAAGHYLVALITSAPCDYANRPGGVLRHVVRIPASEYAGLAFSPFILHRQTPLRGEWRGDSPYPPPWPAEFQFRAVEDRQSILSRLWGQRSESFTSIARLYLRRGSLRIPAQWGGEEPWRLIEFLFHLTPVGARRRLALATFTLGKKPEDFDLAVYGAERIPLEVALSSLAKISPVPASPQHKAYADQLLTALEAGDFALADRLVTETALPWIPGQRPLEEFEQPPSRGSVVQEPVGPPLRPATERSLDEPKLAPETPPLPPTSRRRERRRLTRSTLAFSLLAMVIVAVAIAFLTSRMKRSPGADTRPTRAGTDTAGTLSNEHAPTPPLISSLTLPGLASSYRHYLEEVASKQSDTIIQDALGLVDKGLTKDLLADATRNSAQAFASGLSSIWAERVNLTASALTLADSCAHEGAVMEMAARQLLSLRQVARSANPEVLANEIRGGWSLRSRPIELLSDDWGTTIARSASALGRWGGAFASFASADSAGREPGAWRMAAAQLNRVVSTASDDPEALSPATGSLSSAATRLASMAQAVTNLLAEEDNGHLAEAADQVAYVPQDVLARNVGLASALHALRLACNGDPPPPSGCPGTVGRILSFYDALESDNLRSLFGRGGDSRGAAENLCTALRTLGAGSASAVVEEDYRRHADRWKLEAWASAAGPSSTDLKGLSAYCNEDIYPEGDRDDLPQAAKWYAMAVKSGKRLSPEEIEQLRSASNTVAIPIFKSVMTSWITNNTDPQAERALAQFDQYYGRARSLRGEATHLSGVAQEAKVKELRETLSLTLKTSLGQYADLRRDQVAACGRLLKYLDGRSETAMDRVLLRVRRPAGVVGALHFPSLLMVLLEGGETRWSTTLPDGALPAGGEDLILEAVINRSLPTNPRQSVSIQISYSGTPVCEAIGLGGLATPIEVPKRVERAVHPEGRMRRLDEHITLPLTIEFVTRQKLGQLEGAMPTLP